MEASMAQTASVLTKEQWIERLQAWAVERWGEARAQAIRADIDATAQHLVMVSEYPLAMEQMPDFFIEESELSAATARAPGDTAHGNRTDQSRDG
jgi:hypothetical protein